tara:strand:+ start:295 stop:489 length:195 start_codon:yes stop_codon:yes gene_type:complete
MSVEGSCGGLTLKKSTFSASSDSSSARRFEEEDEDKEDSSAARFAILQDGFAQMMNSRPHYYCC